MTTTDLTELLAELVRIDSQNPDLVAGAPGERALAEFCVRWLEQHGIESWIDEVKPGRCNAIARVRGGDGPTLALCAHLDTVSIEGMSAPGLEPRVADGRMYGRGTYDMKGGVAAIMAALVEIAARPPHGTVMAALVCDEEFASIGASDVVRRYACDACIVTEPSEGRLIVAHKGFVWVEIETTGVAAHGSRWQEGVSAIARMGRIIAALDHFDGTVLRGRTHALLGPASMHCATVAGGDGWSTYAQHCTLHVERRTLPGESPEAVLSEVRAVIAEAGEEAEVRDVLSRAPLECSPDTAIARAVHSAVRDDTGAPPEIAGVGYWMDAAIFADAGADTVDYGPTGTGAHGALEWVDLESVGRCGRVLAAAAARYFD